MKWNKKSLFIIIVLLAGIIASIFGWRWWYNHNAIRYAVPPTGMLAITGNDYGDILHKLHNYPLIQQLEDDDRLQTLTGNDFLHSELAHADFFKAMLKGKRVSLCFKANSENYLQSMLAVEIDRKSFDSLVREVVMKDYSTSSYSAPYGEITEAYNSSRMKELALSYAHGVMIISHEALFVEEAQKSISKHYTTFKSYTPVYAGAHLYLNQEALEQWVQSVTVKAQSEFYHWMEGIDECEFLPDATGSKATFRMKMIPGKSSGSVSGTPAVLHLETWVQTISHGYCAWHPDTVSNELQLQEIYRCYSGSNDENISNGTFIIGVSRFDSAALNAMFVKHSIEQYRMENNRKVFKFGKYPFFRNFANNTTQDLPSTYASIIAPNVFLIAPTAEAMEALLRKIENDPVSSSVSDPLIFVMQVNPQNLLPYFSSCVRSETKDNILKSSFLRQLSYIRLQVNTLAGAEAQGQLFLNENLTLAGTDAELIWSKNLEFTPLSTQVIKGNTVNESFLMIQDERNVLHCLDFNNKERWQKFVTGSVVGEIFPVDIYHNHGLQYYFRTENELFLINDKGQDIEGFPKPLPEEAKHGMYLFNMGDYYEYFFTDAENIYGYNQSGVLLENWNPMEAPESIDRPILQYKKRSKNYLVGIHNEGEIFIWNRFGKRVERDLNFDRPFINEFCITPYINKKYREEIITVDTSGEIISILTDSLVRKNYRHKLKSDQGFVVIQTMDSTFQKIAAQVHQKLVLFDRYTQKSDSITIPKGFILESVVNATVQDVFPVFTNGEISVLMNKTHQLKAANMEGKVIAILPALVPGHFTVLTRRGNNTFNLYSFTN